MKNSFLLFCILPCFISCSNDDSDNDPNPNPGLEIGYPQEWVFTAGGETTPPTDPSVAEYDYIYTNGSAMFRDNILKSYPLSDLVEEEKCLWYVAEAGKVDGKMSYTIQLNENKSRFLGVGMSSNKEEVHLYIANGILVTPVGSQSYYAPPDGDDGAEYQFYIHKMPSVNDVTTVAIESAGMPGWFISDSPPGFNYAQNIVTFQQSKNATGAPKWQCRGAN
ncbi:hypothetical protein [Ohtaekwangia koreensis]|uniref:Uncharacterized protein n=1 Tax=Ohtaekwangia koreensis TaxID=688867 RepID=A0A1T5M597_9BACT|nr:hypothetical protein [Ohtaekwangia koreensis]SKC83303.1 hypothetical protein SAMN05660236_4414 [Ohtaekwangia koreensis]